MTADHDRFVRRMVWWADRARWLRDRPGVPLPPQLNAYDGGALPEWHADLAALVVSRAAEAVSGCLEWTGAGADTGKGYGRIKFRGRLYAPHRVVLEHTLGRTLAGNEDACHHCDNPPCVRAEHLFAGSRRANMRDAQRKGRLEIPAGFSVGENGFVRGSTESEAQP